MDAIESMQVHLTLMELHAMAETFDYSSTQILSEWMHTVLRPFPPLAPALDKLDTLAQAVEITSGLYQSEIWAMFRDNGHKRLRDAVAPDLLHALEGIDDHGGYRTFRARSCCAELRYSALQALVALSGPILDPSGQAELRGLLQNIPTVRADMTAMRLKLMIRQTQKGQQPTSSRKWDNWHILASMELSLLLNSATSVGLIVDARHC